MIRLVVAVLLVELQCLGAAFAGAPADPSSSAPKTTPAEQAAPKAPAKDAAKEAAKAGGERIGDWTLFCPEAKSKTEPPPALSSNFSSTPKRSGSRSISRSATARAAISFSWCARRSVSRWSEVSK
jgi:hypothetical protein